MDSRADHRRGHHRSALGHPRTGHPATGERRCHRDVGGRPRPAAGASHVTDLHAVDGRGCRGHLRDLRSRAAALAAHSPDRGVLLAAAALGKRGHRSVAWHHGPQFGWRPAQPSLAGGGGRADSRGRVRDRPRARARQLRRQCHRAGDGPWHHGHRRRTGGPEHSWRPARRAGDRVRQAICRG